MRFASMMAEIDDEDEAPKSIVPPDQIEQPVSSSNEEASVAPSNASKPSEEQAATAMVQRHRIELAEVEEQCRKKLSESKKKSKMHREAAQTECDEMKRECINRHEKELSSLPPSEQAVARKLASISLNEESAEAGADEKPGFAYSAADGKKKGKQQRRKEAKAEQEEKRYQEAKASMKDWVDPKEVEERQLQVLRCILDQPSPASCQRILLGPARFASLRRMAPAFRMH